MTCFKISFHIHRVLQTFHSASRMSRNGFSSAWIISTSMKEGGKRRIGPKPVRAASALKRFKASSAVVSWEHHMDRINIHHQYSGHRMAAGRQDFGLVEYLWQSVLLSLQGYRDLSPNTAAATDSAHNIAHPPVSPRPTEGTTVVDERRRDEKALTERRRAFSVFTVGLPL